MNDIKLMNVTLYCYTYSWFFFLSSFGLLCTPVSSGCTCAYTFKSPSAIPLIESVRLRSLAINHERYSRKATYPSPLRCWWDTDDSSGWNYPWHDGVHEGSQQESDCWYCRRYAACLIGIGRFPSPLYGSFILDSGSHCSSIQEATCLNRKNSSGLVLSTCFRGIFRKMVWSRTIKVSYWRCRPLLNFWGKTMWSASSIGF